MAVCCSNVCVGVTKIYCLEIVSERMLTAVAGRGRVASISLLVSQQTSAETDSQRGATVSSPANVTA